MCIASTKATQCELHSVHRTYRDYIVCIAGIMMCTVLIHKYKDYIVCIVDTKAIQCASQIHKYTLCIAETMMCTILIQLIYRYKDYIVCIADIKTFHNSIHSLFLYLICG